MTTKFSCFSVCPGSSPSSPVKWGRSNYCFVTEEMPWDTAFSECTLAGGRLVVIRSAEENEFLRSVIEERGTGSNWVGLMFGDEGWAWIDKSETYLNWAPGEGTPGANTCARMKDDTGKLHDRRCTSMYAYICEEEIVWK
ncbi:Asialoglycoprotein receptor 1 [Holothuria leucospilota]|uniref:Asialoglycoprotein receptor 1 n=1 Tax=Holothuria leucospilota TaxID=206669 RepID=A0A9Q1C251_HOLLE|nr:Asialoglycoprotein receptor 1 [Holothuria leucospilota]